jgi:hypothetical protein
MIRPRYCFPTRMFATLFVVLTRGTPRYRSEFQRMKRTSPLRPSAIPGSMLGQATHRRTPATLPRDRPHSHTLVQSHLQLRPPYPHPRPANASLQSQVAPEKSCEDCLFIKNASLFGPQIASTSTEPRSPAAMHRPPPTETSLVKKWMKIE